MLDLAAILSPNYSADVSTQVIQWFSVYDIIMMPLYASAVLIGASRILEGLLGLPYTAAVLIFAVLVGAYVIFGGIKGVMYTDALQGGLMFLGMLILLIFTAVLL
jgi:SSS family solute:Na+ symporter